MYNIPVLFVIFNRPEIAYKSFIKIKDIKPKKLYIAQDGPRKDKESEGNKVIETRKCVMDLIDWPCEVKTLFQDYNLGCGKGVYTAISWLFDNEEMGIVLEDDCVVNSSFFLFMEEMLNKYKDDQRVGMVAGSNLIHTYHETRSSYFFSRYKSCWGWGSWRRAWRNMDLDMNWRKNHLMDVINNSGYYAKGHNKWLYQLRCIDTNYVSAWDWQWFFSLASENQLCIYPCVNLVSNIGNDVNATHTSFGCITYEAQDLIFPLKEPGVICPNEEFDKAFWKKENSLRFHIQRFIPNSLKIRLKRITKKMAHLQSSVFDLAKDLV